MLAANQINDDKIMIIGAVAVFFKPMRKFICSRHCPQRKSDASLEFFEFENFSIKHVEEIVDQWSLGRPPSSRKRLFVAMTSNQKSNYKTNPKQTDTKNTDSSISFIGFSGNLRTNNNINVRQYPKISIGN